MAFQVRHAPTIWFILAAMNLLSYDIVWLLLILFTLNFIGLALIRSDERFWLPSTLFWIILLCTLLVNGTLNKNNVVEKEAIYNAQTVPESKSYDAAVLGWEAARKQEQQENLLLLRLTGFQTFLCLLCQLLGYKLTSKEQFKKGAIAFLALLILFGVFELGRLFLG